MSVLDRTTCPVCGHVVRIVGGDEGTQHYEPVEADIAQQIERLPDPELMGLAGVVEHQLRERGLRE